VLDEPTDGLDPNQKYEVRSLIRRMGETKAIVFSTHILEEVDAACTRAIIIDRGQIVANGTPQELRQRSELAGAVSLGVQRSNGASVLQKVQQLSSVRRCNLVKEDALGVLVRAFPQPNARNGDLEQSLSELALRENWGLTQVRTEEGRLDEVFRNITLPDTAQAEKTK
jgi:ABC-2 type transport system ATP-binding protein